MYSSCTDRPTYTGARMFPFAPPFAGPIMGHHAHPESHGFCHNCCHPRSRCMCGRCECRKEAKELLVKAKVTGTVIPEKPTTEVPFLNLMMAGINTAAAAAAAEKLGDITIGTAFIGGGCCVHLSVEYIANNPAIASGVGILVEDSEGTYLGWGRLEPVGTPYQTKQGIITTKPGATLTVIVTNATARVRWCEIFSC